MFSLFNNKLNKEVEVTPEKSIRTITFQEIIEAINLLEQYKNKKISKEEYMQALDHDIDYRIRQ